MDNTTAASWRVTGLKGKGTIMLRSSVLVSVVVAAVGVSPTIAHLQPMVPIAGGGFQMGDHHGDDPTGNTPIHAVYVGSFYMDVYEMTNQTYCAYLNAAYAQGLVEVTDGVVYKTGGSERYCATAGSVWVYSHIIWDGSTFSFVADKENHPMVEVTWYGAAAYANWRSAQDGLQPCYDPSTWDCDFAANGYRLPTEAEWEYAARGGEDSPYYRYPWGDAISGSDANYRGSGDPYEGEFPPGIDTAPVGYYDSGQTPAGSDMANGYGLYDMAGNLYEWCNDWWATDYYSSSPYENPHGPATGDSRVVRGGSWWDNQDHLRYLGCAHRTKDGPNSLNFIWGFRLVRALAEPGACCLSDGECVTHLSQGDCEGQGGTYGGEGTSCLCLAGMAVPAIGAWGLLVMVLLIVGAGSVVFRRMRVAA